MHRFVLEDDQMSDMEDEDPKHQGIFSNNRLASLLLVWCSYLVVLVFTPLSLLFTIKVVREYERAVIFRLGRLLPGDARGPGLFFILPCIDNYKKIDLRVVSFDVPPQEILSKDSVTVSVDAVVYFRISNPIISVTNVNDAFYSTKLLAQTTLRNILGIKTLAEMLSQREHISHMMQSMLDDATDPWGVKVERVEVKDIRLPDQLMRAMAAEAEATREARARVVASEGELRSSKSLRAASEIIVQSPAALQLRYLQTLCSIATEQRSTILFPVPVDLMKEVFGMANDKVEEEALVNVKPDDPPVRQLSSPSTPSTPFKKMPSIVMEEDEEETGTTSDSDDYPRMLDEETTIRRLSQEPEEVADSQEPKGRRPRSGSDMVLQAGWVEQGEMRVEQEGTSEAGEAHGHLGHIDSRYEWDKSLDLGDADNGDSSKTFDI